MYYPTIVDVFLYFRYRNYPESLHSLHEYQLAHVLDVQYNYLHGYYNLRLRIYQNHNDFDTNSAYSTYKDVVLADSNGNVGIGTASPSTKLHVNGNITCTTLVGNCSGTTTSINITEDT